MGVLGDDMSFSVAKEMGSNVTYGWRIVTVTALGPSDGKLAVNDIIIAMNGQTIKNNEDLASYLEENTIPGDKLVLTVERAKEQIPITITLGTRPAASS